MGDTEPPKSIYDAKETPEDDLWFLPSPPEDAAPTDPPWTIADREITTADAWTEAEREHAVLLARAAGAFGALNDRLKQLGEGARHRIALAQVAGFCWHLEGRLSGEQIALYLAARFNRAGDAMPALARAGWAMRRLLDTHRVLDAHGVHTGRLAEFLGRTAVADGDTQYHVDRPQGEEFAALETLFWAQLSELHASHPITRAALAWDLWQKLGLSGEAARIEGAVVAARVGAQAMIGKNYRRDVGFLPLAIGRNHGMVSARLQRFYTGVENECMAALLTLDRMAAWTGRAGAVTAPLSGRAPALIIEALAQWPMLSAQALEAQTGVSRAAVQRNLDRLFQLGLVREVTGCGRFRMWAAKG